MSSFCLSGADSVLDFAFFQSAKAIWPAQTYCYEAIRLCLFLPCMIRWLPQQEQQKTARLRAGLCNSVPAVPDLPTLQNGSNLSYFSVDFLMRLAEGKSA